MAKITDIRAFELLDCRGNPTVGAEVILDDARRATASVPSGESRGKHEAIELRDGDESRYQGLGVLTAVANIRDKIKPAICGFEASEQQKIDKTMLDLDGTENKANLGANSILAVSLAVAKAAALSFKIPLYTYIQKIAGITSEIKSVTPLFNIINGGLHGSGKFNFQEFMIIPNPAFDFLKALQMGVEVYHHLKDSLKKKGLNYSVGDEGGFTPNLFYNEEVLKLLKDTISTTRYKYAQDIHLGLDLASSCFYHNDIYEIDKGGECFTEVNFIQYLSELARKYQLFLLEDPLPEDNWESWRNLTQLIGTEVIIVGDDLLVTNDKRVKRAIAEKACNSVLVKVNQIGTLSETLEVVRLSQAAGFKVVISHRSGETNDTFIADLAVGVRADFVKFGAPARGERVAKYNRLSEIYETTIQDRTPVETILDRHGSC